MHILLNRSALTDAMNCSKCGWEGKGETTEQEDLFLTDALELYCPVCKNYMGFINTSEEVLEGAEST